MDAALRARIVSCVGHSLPANSRGKIGPVSRNIRAYAEKITQNNVVIGPQSHVREMAVAGSGLSRKEQLELEVKMLLEKENSWWKEGPIPENLITATTPKHFKSLVLEAPTESIVVAYFFSPSCHACRSLFPKMKQIAANNLDDVTFVKINTADKELAGLADGLQVAKLPWFIIYEAGTGKQFASFTANVSTVSNLRAEIAAAKDCTAPECGAH